jgi:hypothetical protein
VVAPASAALRFEQDLSRSLLNRIAKTAWTPAQLREYSLAAFGASSSSALSVEQLTQLTSVAESTSFDRAIGEVRETDLPV